jgi:molybdate transport system substrate-binding protein
MANRLPLLGVLLLIGCGSPPSGSAPAAPAPLQVFAATSTRSGLEKAVPRTAPAKEAFHVSFTFGPSSVLAKQIAEGAKADLFLSADVASVQYLAGRGLVAERRDLLTNRLAVVVPADSQLTLWELRDLAQPAVKRLALGEPAVPVGEYARQALGKVGILDELKPRVVGGYDVAATLQLVARGEVDAGIVYATDARGQARVRVALEVPADLHQPIVYPLVLLKGAQPQARRLADYLFTVPDYFTAEGFGVLPGKVSGP